MMDTVASLLALQPRNVRSHSATRAWVAQHSGQLFSERGLPLQPSSTTGPNCPAASVIAPQGPWPECDSPVSSTLGPPLWLLV